LLHDFGARQIKLCGYLLDGLFLDFLYAAQLCFVFQLHVWKVPQRVFQIDMAIEGFEHSRLGHALQHGAGLSNETGKSAQRNEMRHCDARGSMFGG